jgi:antitoxin component YwqK of YwqJK toxin-antitoxin module
MSIVNLDVYTGVHRTYYKTGELESEVFMNNGKKEGEYKEFYESGQLWEICNYINDKKEGEYKILYKKLISLLSILFDYLYLFI